jgi:hypothetical protein
VSTPFDAAIAAIAKARYHNHRLETHSDSVSDGIVEDLRVFCEPFRRDLEDGVVRVWKNVSSPGDRRRKVDLFVGEPGDDGGPDIHRVRIAVENKSVITAHRNRTNRFDDLSKVLGAVHSARPEALLVATVMIGLAERVLNIPDHVHKVYRDDKEEEFEEKVLPRLSSGDSSLWDEFSWAVSRNSKIDPQNTAALFRTLPTRGAGHTHKEGYDYVLLVPVFIDNVNPPSLPRDNSLKIDVDAEYGRLIEQMCSAYTARWHM